MQPEAVSRISRLELQARNVVEGFLSGLHRSPYFGQSVEFVQHREYVAGDDPRRIDWKAWSKTDKYYIKQYEEDTNLRCTLLVDLSESMQFGSLPVSRKSAQHVVSNKYEYACAIAASLAYLLLRQQDSVGMVTFDAKVRSVIPSRSKRNHLHAVLAALDAQNPAEKTDIYSILAEVADQQSQRGMIVLISDMFVPREGLFKGLKLLRHRGHDVMLFQVLDDEELDFNYSGTTRFEGLEEMGELVCDPRALREGYLEALQAFLEELRRHCSKNTIDFQTIRTSEHLDAVLAHYISHRLGMGKSVRS
ncbi:MAG: DUF58 domain-containing protein [Planctomycetes bacterium]|nr:DUF58 domain-containing protein [Planctomycetota bacterium]